MKDTINRTMQRVTEFINSANPALAEEVVALDAEVQPMNFYRFRKGQIIEERGQPDLLGILEQIGAFPQR